MSKPKVTGWYPWNVKPFRSGVYEVMTGSRHKSYAYYDVMTNHWGGYQPSVWYAYLMRGSSAQQTKTWRGLAEPPAEAKKK